MTLHLHGITSAPRPKSKRCDTRALEAARQKITRELVEELKPDKPPKQPWWAKD